MPSDKLPPQPQEFYDENRERFGADMSAVDVTTLPSCDHVVKRVRPIEVVCIKCSSGWVDMGRFIIKDGKITGISK